MKADSFPAKCMCVACVGLATGIAAMTDPIEKDCGRGSICRNLPIDNPHSDERDHSPGPPVGLFKAVASSNFQQTILRRTEGTAVVFKGING
jgi:hypothetical protein